jgi:hypothetical protein
VLRRKMKVSDPQQADPVPRTALKRQALSRRRQTDP